MKHEFSSHSLGVLLADPTVGEVFLYMRDNPVPLTAVCSVTLASSRILVVAPGFFHNSRLQSRSPSYEIFSYPLLAASYPAPHSGLLETFSTKLLHLWPHCPRGNAGLLFLDKIHLASCSTFHMCREQVTRFCRNQLRNPSRPPPCNSVGKLA